MTSFDELSDKEKTSKKDRFDILAAKIEEHEARIAALEGDTPAEDNS